MHIDLEAVVMGGGAVGLAVARSLSASLMDVLLVEKESAVGRGTSSRNSGVIHSGIYYETGSLKQKLCLRGNHLLQEFLQKYPIDSHFCGKLIVGQADDEQTLADLKLLGETNGVEGISLLTQREVNSLEPLVRASYALRVPSAGHLDVFEYCNALEHAIASNDGTVIFNTVLRGVSQSDSGWVLSLQTENETFTVHCQHLINACGLWSFELEKLVFMDEPLVNYRLGKGHYFTTSKKNLFTQHIYPVPPKNGLGIHATVSASGDIKFGPDFTWIDTIDYSVDASLATDFRSAISHYFPAIKDLELQPDYAGVRPRLSDEPRDFFVRIEHWKNCTYTGLHGIESPGLTSSLAIGEAVKGVLQQGDLTFA